MKKIILFFLLFFISKTYSQQKLNWAEVLYGDIKNLRENKIKTLKLKKGNKVFRSVTVISENSIIVKDSLAEFYFEFDNEDRLISVKSIKEKIQEKFGLNFKNNFVNGISKLTDEKGVEIYNQLSKVYFNNISYEEKETYSFDKEKKDSLNVFRTKYFFNEQNPELSYKETYNNGKTFGRKYFNDTEVWKEKFSDYYVVDSILKKDSSIDTKKEFVRMSKSITRNGRLLKYFKDLEVEVVTFSDKKYNINLSEHPDFLSFPIYTFLTKEKY
ncbi:hypothetical protein [Chryseobacterium geocarposphaerae]|uniref:Uncharacterized protein n=1 Tax=Chryseobacterium geocarposphaerae TaxID=1416776 RepID=A0A2M9C180_9FLAO|nr:hypothetical protein [Chryseobacterium geocarposphaerae]PJJ64138.1 hypothetical protein CLV73_2493 [Chryseobacterium geocarposphaerae]